MGIHKDVRLEEDVIASIKTMASLEISMFLSVLEASEEYIKPGGMKGDTQPPLDLENLVSKFVFGKCGKSKPVALKRKSRLNETLAAFPCNQNINA